MNEEKFCVFWCNKLTHEQIIMLNHHIKKGTFIGVGRAIGRMAYMPLVLIGKTVNVIDKAGYYQLASIDGRKEYQ